MGLKASLLLGVLCSGLSLAQDTAQPSVTTPGSPDYDPRRNVRVIRPGLSRVPDGLIGKLLAMEDELQQDGVAFSWRDYYLGKSVDIDPRSLPDDEALLCVLLGFRLADGILALRAEDSESLSNCADDIEALAIGIGIPEAHLRRGESVKKLVEKRQWIRAYTELAFYRQDVMRSLDDPFAGAPDQTGRDKGVIIAAAAWYQGSRIILDVLGKNYDAERTNYLRDGGFTQIIDAELRSIQTPSLRNSAEVERFLSDLQKITPLVTLHEDETLPSGQIKPEGITELSRIANEFVKEAVLKNRGKAN